MWITCVLCLCWICLCMQPVVTTSSSGASSGSDRQHNNVISTNNYNRLRGGQGVASNHTSVLSGLRSQGVAVNIHGPSDRPSSAGSSLLLAVYSNSTDTSNTASFPFICISHHLKSHALHHCNKNITNFRFNVQNSKFAKQQISSFPSKWQAPILFGAIADEKYLLEVDLFYQALLSFGYTKYDILLVCASELCSEVLQKKGIYHVVFIDLGCGHGEVRCLIGDAKNAAVYFLLQYNISVFFFDLDVYLKKSPLSLVPKDEFLMYIQDNVEQVAYNRLNFGVFLTRAHPDTIKLFATLIQKIRTTHRWDQDLFNAYVLEYHVAHQLLPRAQYFAFEADFPNFDINNMVLTHMICVEGSKNKLIIGKTLFGPYSTPHEYRPQQRTLTYVYDHRGIVELQLEIGMLIDMIKQTQRLLRVVYPRYGEGLSLFDADALFRVNVTLVEPNFWKNVHFFNPNFTQTETKMQVYNYKDAMKVIQSNNDSSIRNVHDLIVEFKEVFRIDPFPWPNNPNYVCARLARKKNGYSCMATCQGLPM